MTLPPISHKTYVAQSQHIPRSSQPFQYSQNPWTQSSIKPLKVHGPLNPFFECLHYIWNLLIAPFLMIYQWFAVSASGDDIQGVVSIPSVPLMRDPSSKWPQVILNVSIDPNSFAHPLKHPNKVVAYNHLTQGRDSLGQPIHFVKCSLTDRSYIGACPINMGGRTPYLKIVEGAFLYSPSTKTEKHFTVNFADRNLMGFCGGGLLAQDELQILEHPALAHLLTGLRGIKRQYMNENEICIAIGVPRLGSLDTRTPGPGAPKGLYGNAFALAPAETITTRLTRFENPVLSNILFIAAPNVGYGDLTGKPYGIEHLRELFYTAFNGFFSCRQACADNEACVIHTGNWGAGAFGNSPTVIYLIQLAAAFAAGVDVNLYPMNEKPACLDAYQIFFRIIGTHPEIGIEEFLGHLHTHAAELNLRYRRSNGT